MSSLSIFSMSGHVFRNTRFKVGHVLLEGTSSMRSGFMGWLIMQVDMYCWKACGSGSLVFHESVRACVVGWPVSQKLQSYIYIYSHSTESKF